MHPPLNRKTQVFVLRIWQEYMQNDMNDLRGELENLATREKFVFSNIQDLEGIVWACCRSEEENQPTNISLLKD
jgi:hypothetical protein